MSGMQSPNDIRAMLCDIVGSAYVRNLDDALAPFGVPLVVPTAIEPIEDDGALAEGLSAMAQPGSAAASSVEASSGEASSGEASSGERVAATGSFRVLPSSPAEVASLIALANRCDIAVLPVGNAARAPRAIGTSERRRLFIDTQRMNHVLRLDETSLIVHVQAGLTGHGLENILAPRRLSVGDYPPAVLRSTMGGLVSVRTPGKSSARHGFVEDAVLGVSAVLGDGRTIHTRVAPRRSTGPDLSRALCGSEGTIGFVTSVVLRIHRVPEARFLCAYALPDFEAALAAVHLALREEAAPSAMRAYDCGDARIHLGADVCADGEAVLVAATAGPTDLAACDRDLIASAADAMDGRQIDKRVAETWWYRRAGQSTPPHPPVPALQVTAKPSKQKAVYRAVCRAIDAFSFASGVGDSPGEAANSGGRQARVHVHASRFDRDGAVMFFTFLDHDSDRVLSGLLLREVRKCAESAARDAGAVPFGDDSPSLASYVEDLRRALDPNGIMNPGALR